MLKEISKNEINTSDLIKFFNDLPENNNYFFKSHPSNKERVILLRKYTNFKKKENSINFEWLKAKYGKNSNIKEFNNFFQSLEKGIVNMNSTKLLENKNYVNYEIYKTGIAVDDIDKIYINLIKTNSNPFLKIEFYNMIIDSNLTKYFEMIESDKNNREIQSEYFFHFLYGKYYNRVNNKDLSNFYFCQFYKMINLKNKSDYYCNNYDIKSIPGIDNSYAILK